MSYPDDTWILQERQHDLHYPDCLRNGGGVIHIEFPAKVTETRQEIHQRLGQWEVVKKT